MTEQLQRPARPPGKGRRRRSGSPVVDLHNVIGLVAAAAVIVVCATGIMLNHLETFGITRKPAEVAETRSPLVGSRPVEEIVAAAQAAELRARGGEGGPADVDRAVWSPADGTVEVWLATSPVKAVIVDDASATVLDQVDRHDLDVAATHSGEIIGKPWVILSDLVAVVLVLSVISGTIIWVRRVRARGRLVGARAGSRWIRANWWLHLVGGLSAATYLIVLSVTGVMLNHKKPLGFMSSSPDLPKPSADFAPVSIPTMVDSAVEFRGADQYSITDVNKVDYRPKGYAKVGFSDDFEVIVDAADASVEKAARRWDLFLEDLHTGLVFGDDGWLLSDIPAGITILLTANGVYLWTRPAWRSRDKHTAGVR